MRLGSSELLYSTHEVDNYKVIATRYTWEEICNGVRALRPHIKGDISPFPNFPGVFLWGCVACRRLRFRPLITSEPQIWVVEKSGNNLQILCDGKLIFKKEFKGMIQIISVSSIT